MNARDEKLKILLVFNVSNRGELRGQSPSAYSGNLSGFGFVLYMSMKVRMSASSCLTEV
jgi:hypothetical protein